MKDYSDIVNEFEEIHTVSVKNSVVYVSGIPENKSYSYIHTKVAKEVQKRISYFIGINGNK